MRDESICQLCGSDQQITFHHLIPRTCHRNKWFRKNFRREEMHTRGINVCRPCHSFIHKQFSEKHLGRELNNLDSLLAEPVIRKYVEWARQRL